MHRKKVVTFGFLAMVVLVYALVGFAANEPDLYAEVTEKNYGEWKICVKYTDPDNNPPDFIYFTLNNETYPAEYPEVKENWIKYKGYFVETDPSDTDYTDGKWYCYKTLFKYGHYGHNYVHFYASDGTTTVEFPRVDWMDVVFGNPYPHNYATPYPYPYPE